MTDDTPARLRKRFASNAVVIVVGAGVSIAATRNVEVDGHRVASWQGLLEHGIAYCVGLGADEPWADTRRKQLQLGEYVEVASAITDKLGGQGSGQFRAWLNRTVGSLRLEERGVLEALRDLGAPLFTTNYDQLLERVTGREALTWKDGSSWQDVNQDPTTGILHLHGYYRRSDTVVLGSRSYEDVLRDEPAQNALHALASTKSLVFVGFGAGIRDPNFGSLRKFMAKVLPDSVNDHYRLVPDDELDAARAEHELAERILPIGFGARGQLESFLRSLRPYAVRPAPTRRVFEVEISKTGVKAQVEGETPVSGELGLDPLRLETLQLLDEWLRLYDEGADVPGGIDKSRIVRHMGTVLYEAVFNGAVRQLYEQQRANRKQKLSIVLKVRNDLFPLPDDLRTVSLSGLPWELLFNRRDGCLATNKALTLSRVLPDGRLVKWDAPKKLRILVMRAQPRDLVDRVKADWDQAHNGDRPYEELVDDIVAGIGELAGDRIDVDCPEEPPTWDGFADILDRDRPYHIVHYIGHGSAGPSAAASSIALVDPATLNATWHPFDEFADVFQAVEEPPILVFLHLCEGPRVWDRSEGRDYLRANFGQLAWQLIERGVSLVVAMQYPISPDVGREFTDKFYRALKVQTVAEAVQTARHEVYSRRSAGGPVLYMRGDDGVIVSQGVMEHVGGSVDQARSSSSKGTRPDRRSTPLHSDPAHRSGAGERPDLRPQAPLPRPVGAPQRLDEAPALHVGDGRAGDWR